MRIPLKWTRAQYLTLTGCALALVAGTTTVTTMTFGIFLLPVSATFGWSRDVLSSAYAAFTVFTALGTPVIGRLVDRHDPRIVLGLGSVLFALTTASLAFISPSRPLLFFLYGIWGLTAAVQLPVGYTKIVSAWFSRDRGLAIGLMLVGSAIGTVIIPILVQAMIQTVGWRAAYLGLGATVLLISVPAIFGLIKRPPDLGPPAPTGRSVEHQPHRPPGFGLSAAQAMRSPKFWAISAALFLVANVIVGLQLHLFPLLKDRGLSVPVATSAVTVAGIAMVAGRLISGLAMDRFSSEKVAAIFFIAPVGAIVALYASSGIVSAIVAAAIIGLCSGAEVAVASVLVAELFGLRAYGQIFSLIFFSFVIGAGSGPWLMAKSYVIFGSYQPGLFLLAAFALTAGALTITLGRGRAQVGLSPRSH